MDNDSKQIFKDIFENLVAEGAGQIVQQLESGHRWLVTNNPLSIDETDAASFLIMPQMLKWHQFDVNDMMASLQDIQTWCLFYAARETASPPANETAILGHNSNRSMTVRRFRSLLVKNGIEEAGVYDYISILNSAISIQWWMLFMLRMIVGANALSIEHLTDAIDEEE